MKITTYTLTSLLLLGFLAGCGGSLIPEKAQGEVTAVSASVVTSGPLLQSEGTVTAINLKLDGSCEYRVPLPILANILGSDSVKSGQRGYAILNHATDKLKGQFVELTYSKKTEEGKSFNLVSDLQFKVTGGTLINAVRAGNRSVVEQLLKNGLDVNARHPQVRGGALEVALRHGHKEIACLLIDKGADVNADGGVALQVALCDGHEDMVQLLAKKGADVVVAHEWGCHALQLAAMKNHKEIVRVLLAKGVDPNAMEEGYTALQHAAEEGREEMVRLLLEKGANPNAREKGPWDKGHYKGGHVYGCTALQLAAENGHVGVVRLLLKNGANADMRNSVGASALDEAVNSEKYETACVLLANGAKSFYSVEGKKLAALYKTPAKDMDYAAALKDSIASENPLALRILLEKKGGDVNHKDAEGKTALMNAAFEGNELAAHLLVEKGAMIDAIDNDGNTALMLAVFWDQESIVRLLLDKGADVNIKNSDGETAEMLAGGGQMAGLIRGKRPSSVKEKPRK